MTQTVTSSDLILAADRLPRLAILQALVAALGQVEKPFTSDTLFQHVAAPMLGNDSPLRIIDDKAVLAQALEALKLAEMYLIGHRDNS